MKVISEEIQKLLDVHRQRLNFLLLLVAPGGTELSKLVMAYQSYSGISDYKIANRKLANFLERLTYYFDPSKQGRRKEGVEDLTGLGEFMIEAGEALWQDSLIKDQSFLPEVLAQRVRAYTALRDLFGANQVGSTSFEVTDTVLRHDTSLLFIKVDSTGVPTLSPLEADIVKQDPSYHAGVPFIIYGTAIGEYQIPIISKPTVYLIAQKQELRRGVTVWNLLHCEFEFKP
jgi:hypothetical protein